MNGFLERIALRRAQNAKALIGTRKKGEPIPDLTGQKFGRLLVLNRIKGDRYLCKCDCGKEVTNLAHRLVNEVAKSCGCLRSDLVIKNHSKDFTGQKFGKLLVKQRMKERGEEAKYLCKCDCGKEITVLGYNLSNGQTEMCLECFLWNKAEDITGQKFGRLLALERIKCSGQAKFLCVCECGKEKIVKANALKSGGTKSCGCLRNEKILEKKIKDVSGQKFGRLLVIKRLDEKGTSKYLCKCDCGKEVIKNISSLRGGFKSCGCLRKERASKACSKDFTGKRFGKLVAIKRIKNDGEDAKYLCKCDCGKEIITHFGSKKSCGCLQLESVSKGGVYERNIALYETFAHQLVPMEEVRRIRFTELGQANMKVRCYKCKKWMVPKRSDVVGRIQCINGQASGESHFYCSEECKENCSIYGQNKYPKGYLPKNNRPYVDAWWRSEVIRLAEGECERCGVKTDKLIAHHIHPATLYPMLANDVDNGLAVCVPCDKEIHSQMGCRFVDLRKKC